QRHLVLDHRRHSGGCAPRRTRNSNRVHAHRAIHELLQKHDWAVVDDAGIRESDHLTPGMVGMNPSLFEADEPPAQAARLRPALRALADQGVFLGTSSWKYEGWIGSIYTSQRYETRRKFSHKRFEANCLREYAETFPIVCGDFSFYQFPTADYWSELF